ncbi:MAG: hypothetical protein EPO39_12190 [Candidatus Manganitrophaceae bacterium]|nr:MAG: hypothetical protein EPO39_12190 [Candidatus Manganitrophaceae bacterium]
MKYLIPVEDIFCYSLGAVGAGLMMETRMRRLILFFILGGLFISCAAPRSYEDLELLHRKRAHYTLTMTTVPTRPHVGDNLFRAQLTDPSGAPISDAEVTFDLRMREMKFMRKVEKGKPVGEGRYEANVDLNMGGEWFVSVEIERPGFERLREKFIIDAGPM